MQPLISIIVPVYNSAQYLRRCLDSLVNQSYENIEIILINDGSTDDSDSICNFYNNNYSTISYLKKDNEGIAITRNFGIRQSNGEYICFVDSDDYVELNMVEDLYRCALNEGSELTVCGCYKEYENNEIEIVDFKNFESISKESAIEYLCLDQYLHSYLWGSLFKKTLFEGIEFTPNKNYEDTSTVYKLYILSNKVVFVSSPMYHYMIRNSNSITADKSIAKLMDLFEILIQRKLDVVAYDKSHCDACDFSIFLNAMDILYRINFSQEKYSNEESTILNYLSNVKIDLYKNKYFKKKNKLILFAVLNLKKLYFKTFELFRKEKFLN